MLEQDVADLWSILFEIVTDSEKRLATQMAKHGLTPPQFFVLKTLVEHGGKCSIGEIARQHHLTSATMTGIIKRLEAFDNPPVVRQNSATDRRSVDVILTPSGMELFAKVMLELQEQAKVILQMFKPEERRDMLSKVRYYYTIFSERFPVE